MKVAILGPKQIERILKCLKAKEDELIITKRITGYGARLGKVEYDAGELQTGDDRVSRYDLLVFSYYAEGASTLVAVTELNAAHPLLKEFYGYLQEVCKKRGLDEKKSSGPAGISFEAFWERRYPGKPFASDDEDVTGRWRGTGDEPRIFPDEAPSYRPVLPSREQKAPARRKSWWRRFWEKLGVLRKAAAKAGQGGGGNVR